MVKKQCEYCKKEFEIYPYRKNSAKFCSIECKIRGYKHSKETRKILSKNHLGLKYLNRKRPPKFTEEHRKHMKLSHLNKRRPKEIMKKTELTRRKRYKEWFDEKAKENMSKAQLGEKSHLWRGGLSFEPYDKNWTNKFKRAIRKRDNQICMLCGIHKEKLNRILDVHHINYNKKLSIPQNCISLCRSCHSKTNQNRQLWIKFFQLLLAEKYRYQYSNQEIIVQLIKPGGKNGKF